jgi:hypothetical protein
MKSVITKYDEELVAVSRTFLAAAKAHADSRAVLEKYGFSAEEQERGWNLVREADRAFEWERAGKAYNFISRTPERRVAEARAWYTDARRRWVRRCLRRAEEAAGWVGNGPARSWPLWRRVTLGTAVGAAHVAQSASFGVWLEHRRELKVNVARAHTERGDAPPPKDTAIVELAGWYERWRLLAHRVFRERPDLLAPYGLVPGKAPPRLREKGARERYGEKAAGSLPIVNNGGLQFTDALN